LDWELCRIGKQFCCVKGQKSSFLPAAIGRTNSGLIMWGIFEKLMLIVYRSYTVEIVYNEHQDQAEFARYNRFSL